MLLWLFKFVITVLLNFWNRDVVFVFYIWSILGYSFSFANPGMLFLSRWQCTQSWTKIIQSLLEYLGNVKSDAKQDKPQPIWKTKEKEELYRYIFFYHCKFKQYFKHLFQSIHKATERVLLALPFKCKKHYKGQHMC